MIITNSVAAAVLPTLLILLSALEPAPRVAASAGGVGVNWGTQASHPLPPSVVVGLLKNNNITKVKLFDADSNALSELAGSGIEVMVGIPNDMLAAIADSMDAATAWVKENVTRYNFQGGVTIKYVAVGNEPFLSSYNGSFVNLTFPALQNIQSALNAAGVGGTIKVTVPMNADVLSDPSNKPSQAVFRNDTAAQMNQILQLLNSSDAPFTVNIYPFISAYDNPTFPENYLYFDSNVVQVTDGSRQYTNTFDASYDTLVGALSNAGYADMQIVVGEVGWPTDGYTSATPTNAQRFNQGFLNHIRANGGTPARPNSAIDFYLFALLDEDLKSIEPGYYERHWGIFAYDGTAKYSLDLNGNGKGLVNGTGVKYLTRQWCVVSSNVNNISSLSDAISYACTFADCTELGYGASCYNQLDAKGNASFAFNQYYQMNNQDAKSCYFDGLASLTTTDPSVGTCKFNIQIDVAASSDGNSKAVVSMASLGFLGMLLALIL